jgi:hypothetical protein
MHLILRFLFLHGLTLIFPVRRMCVEIMASSQFPSYYVWFSLYGSVRKELYDSKTQQALNWINYE